MTVGEERQREDTPGASRSAAHPFVSLSRAAFKGFVRDKAAMFFTILFPLMFLVILGLLFGDGGSSRLKVGAVGQGPVLTALERSGAVEVVDVASADEAEQQVKAGDLPAYVAQDGDNVTLRFAASDQTRAGTVVGLVRGVVSEANVRATGQPPTFTLDAARVEDESLRPIQFLTPGLLSWAVSMSAVFGAALTLVMWRKNQVLRRLRLAPVRPMTILGSRIAVSLVIAVSQGVIFVGVAMLPVFGLQLSGSWWLAIPLLLLGTLSFFAIGMLVGAFAKTEEAATGAANLIVLPMAFLSGAFFPMDQVPQWLRTLSLAFPMRHLNEGMSDVLVRGQGVDAILLPAVILIGFTVVVGFVASRVFRWEKS
ncbi:ABC transporter permease [Haloechinothrix salitolerans]|uniref:ABC transporter permease n=1 Tax=Haloechinothrix salitolerans TaxID=926830 RepID=A0ABW2C7P1_9PSEU